MLYSTVALSVIISFLTTELTGLLTGGMISAGSTLLMSILIALIIRVSRHFLILYGRRRFMLSILLSIFGVYLVEKSYFFVSEFSFDMRIIGYIIPGLIASDMEKQGILRTTIALSAVTIVVKLLSLLGGIL